MTRVAAAGAIALASIVVLAGCAAPRPLPITTPSPSATITASGDGVLRIGTLFPMSGDVAFIGPALVAAVETAARDINAAGGVLGEPIEVFARDSGDVSDETLEAAFAELVDRDVDVIIGPATSALAERLIPLAAQAGIAVISPAATYPTLRTIDPDGIFFRTIPSYELQGQAIVDALVGARAESVALVTMGGELGLALELNVRAAFEGTGVDLVSVEQLDALTNARRLAFSVAASEPDAVILATDASLDAAARALIENLADRGIAGESLWLTSQNLADYSATLPAGTLEGASGVLEGAEIDDAFATRLRQSDPALLSFRYAPEAYDAVILAALAAVLADDDSGSSIAAMLGSASRDGIACASVGECLSVLETETDIDYRGVSGPLDLASDGELAVASWGLYRYTAENRPEQVGTLVAEARPGV